MKYYNDVVFVWIDFTEMKENLPASQEVRFPTGVRVDRVSPADHEVPYHLSLPEKCSSVFYISSLHIWFALSTKLLL